MHSKTSATDSGDLLFTDKSVAGITCLLMCITQDDGENSPGLYVMLWSDLADEGLFFQHFKPSPNMKILCKSQK